MIKGQWKFAAIASLGIVIAACQQQPGSTAGTGATTAGGTTAPADTGTSGGTTTGTTTGTTGGTTVPNLVNVSLRNVLNNLSVALHVEQANIPVNAQVPIDVAANVCGVSVNVLAASCGERQRQLHGDDEQPHAGAICPTAIVGWRRHDDNHRHCHQQYDVAGSATLLIIH